MLSLGFALPRALVPSPASGPDVLQDENGLSLLDETSNVLTGDF